MVESTSWISKLALDLLPVSLIAPLYYFGKALFQTLNLVVCLLTCWTSNQSRSPWHHVAQAIGKVNAMHNVQAHIVQGVQNALHQPDVNSKELCQDLAQLVLQQVDALGLG